MHTIVMLVLPSIWLPLVVILEWCVNCRSRLGTQASMTVVAGTAATPLHQAALKGHKDLVSVLLDAGCPIDVVDSEGGNALHNAAGAGNVEVLIERGSGVNIEDNDGRTPLHWAAIFGKLEVVSELLHEVGCESVYDYGS